jgi:protein-S-isoprenylcysteine O-methyltransferase Ste14
MKPLVYLSIGYAFSEMLLMILKRSKSGKVKTREDKGSLILLWLMITLGFTGGFLLSKSANLFWSGFGVTFIIGGLIVRWIAILQLGNAFTVDVAITNAANLKTDGIYEKVRHPSYSGILAIVIGFGVTMNSLYSFLVLVLPVFIAVIFRIGVEEKVLIKEFGNSYLEYKSKTKKLVPGIF